MNKFLIFIILLGFQMAFSQKITPENPPQPQPITWNTDPLSPAKAAFYSALIPGLGQAYNGSYWKIPFVYGAIGTGIYFYQRNTHQLNRYRNAYKRRLDGFKDDEFYGNRPDGRPLVSDDGLRKGQQFYQRNKEISLLVTIGFYALNIIEANVNAHLKQFNVDENLSFQPFLDVNPTTFQPQYGISLTFNF